MREQLKVRRFAAARTRAGVFDQRLVELAGFDLGLDELAVGLEQRKEELVVEAFGLAQRKLRGHVERFVLGVRLVLGRTHLNAQRAARAILGRDLDGEIHAGYTGRAERRVFEGLRSGLQRRRLVVFRPHGRVGADEHALVALDAQRRIPHGDFLGDVALFPFRRAQRPTPVHGKRAHRQQVALPGKHQARHALHEIRCRLGHRRRAAVAGVSGGRHGYLVQRRERGIHGGKIFLNHLRPLAGVSLLDGTLDLRDRLLARKHPRNREEARLHDRIDPRAHARLARHLVGVDGEQSQLARHDGLLRLVRERRPHALRPVNGIDQHHRPRCSQFQDVHPVKKFPLVDADEIRPAHEVGAADGARPEAQV